MMLRFLIRNLLVLFGVLAPGFTYTQVHDPVKWKFTVTAKGDGLGANLNFTAQLEDGWHIYSQFIAPDGPLPTSIKFDESQDYSLVRKVKEIGKAIRSYDSTFLMEIVWFSGSATFSQEVKLHVPETTIKGVIEFMACNEEMCLPPKEIKFSLNVKAAKPGLKSSNEKKDKQQSLNLGERNAGLKVSPGEGLPKSKSSNVKGVKLEGGPDSISTAQPQKNHFAENNEKNTPESKTTIASLWRIFITGLLGGFAALVMPCIFPMLPFTVGYFSKRAGGKSKSIKLALIYGLSIVIIYVSIGVLVTIVFGSTALNQLATNGIINFLIFSILLYFALAFFGSFEINLPSTWVNRADELAFEKKGWVGIFWMAGTLSLVSFSCTGPIIGTLLVTSVNDGIIGPVAGMFGFSIGIALPFTIFATFPALLTTLPKSGTWLNSIKVVIGFLELALALKFLSNVDLAYHWELLDREVFLVLWIIIFGMMGFYLLGKIRLPHDTPLNHVSPVRMILAIITLAFCIYMIPGLWGAPLKAIAAFLPPQTTQDFDLYNTNIISNITPDEFKTNRKYSDLFKAPLNLDAFFDYEEGLAHARRVNKPVLLDFTGHACVNCRKMETNVWSDPEVLKRLDEQFVIVQLYVDDRSKLSAKEKETFAKAGKNIETIGKKWSEFQAEVYKTNSQPFYVLIGHDGKLLTLPKGADYNANNFKNFLDEGLAIFRSKPYPNDTVM